MCTAGIEPAAPVLNLFVVVALPSAWFVRPVWPNFSLLKEHYVVFEEILIKKDFF